MNIQEARAFFPVVEDQLYLNHAACSPFSTRVSQALTRYTRSRVDGPIDNFKEDLAETELLREHIALLIQAAPDRVALTQNTTHGLNIIAQGLDWQAGDEIMISTMEFPANVYPFLNLKAQGVNIRWLEGGDGRVSLEAITEHINEHTQMIALSFVQYLNGYRANLQDIGYFCAQNDILFIVDGIQGLGAVPLSVQKCHIDALATGGQKWLMAPKGIGFMYLSEQLQTQLKMRYLGWLSVEQPFEFHNFDQEHDQTARRFELATPNHAGIYGMNAALQLLLEVGIGNIQVHLCDLTDYLRSQLKEAGCQILTPFSNGERAGIILFSCGDTEENKRIYKSLMERKVTISYRAGLLRVAPHFYNNREDMDQFVQTLKEVM